MVNTITPQQQKYLMMIWNKGISKLGYQETNSPEYLSTYGRILKSLKNTNYLTKNSDNEVFSKRHGAVERRMDIEELTRCGGVLI